MRIRVESPFPIHAGLFKPARVRKIAAVEHAVHWYDVPQQEIDTFLREIYHNYASNYSKVIHEHVQYQWYASLTIYYRGTTVCLNLSYSRLRHNPERRLQFRKELSGDFGFFPCSIEFWEYDSERVSFMCHDVRKILNAMVKGVAK